MKKQHRTGRGLMRALPVPWRRFVSVERLFFAVEAIPDPLSQASEALAAVRAQAAVQQALPRSPHCRW
jgi:hypothetical protein